jgi:hypothetical protein
MSIDPLYLHRLLRLADQLEVDEDSITQVDDDETIFYCDGRKYRVIAEIELTEELLKIMPADKNEFDIKLLVEYLHLPSARACIMSMLQPGYEPISEVAALELLDDEEREIDDYFRDSAARTWSPMLDEEEERPGRFLIYEL